MQLQQVVQSTINLLRNNKSPGTDSLTAEFHEVFATELACFCVKESLNEESLPPTMTQGLTTLIPKLTKTIYLIILILIHVIFRFL